MNHTHTTSSSGRVQDRTTPRAFFLQLDHEFHFTLDAAADETNHLCPRYFSIQEDALARDWPGVVWCNPPFSQCDAFVRKGAREAAKGSTVVFLVPARTDTAWWHEVVLPFAEIRYVRGRLRYGGGVRRPRSEVDVGPVRERRSRLPPEARMKRLACLLLGHRPLFAYAPTHSRTPPYYRPETICLRCPTVLA